MLGSKTPSTTSLASGGERGAVGAAGDPELSPSKRNSGTPPPIPPKPKQSQNNKQLLNHCTYLNKEELLRSMENEDKLNENATTTTSASDDPNNAGAVTVERSSSRNSTENGTLGKVRKSQQHKEFYTLPGKEPVVKDNQ